MGFATEGDQSQETNPLGEGLMAEGEMMVVLCLQSGSGELVAGAHPAVSFSLRLGLLSMKWPHQYVGSCPVT